MYTYGGAYLLFHDERDDPRDVLRDVRDDYATFVLDDFATCKTVFERLAHARFMEEEYNKKESAATKIQGPTNYSYKLERPSEFSIPRDCLNRHKYFLRSIVIYTPICITSIGKEVLL